MPNYGQSVDLEDIPKRLPVRVNAPVPSGQPMDPNLAPPKPATRSVHRAVGSPVDIPVPAQQAAILKTLSLGYSTGQEAPQLPPGVSSRGSNFVSQDGGLAPRPGLRSLSTLSSVMLGASGQAPGWVGEYVTSDDRHFPVELCSYFPAWFSRGSWSQISQLQGSGTTPIGRSLNTLSLTEAFFDAVNYYHPVSDKLELCFVQGVAGQLAYTTAPFAGSDPATFSTLTGAPGAKYVTGFDNRLVFANIVTEPSASSTVAPTSTAYPQRVWWSARGDPETYTAPDGGFEELLDAVGVITRIIRSEDRVLVFFNKEIWQGLKVAFPFNFQFSVLDRTVGTEHPWSVAQTPWGIMFLGTDFNVYLIPPGGTPVPVGGDIWRLLRENVATAAANKGLANGVYNASLGAYMLTYRSKDGGEHGVLGALKQGGMIWSPIGFDIPNGWQIRRLGLTSNQTVQANSGGAGAYSRVLVATGASLSTTTVVGRSVLEFTSEVTNDLGTPIDCRALFVVPNPNPTERQILTEVRLDYRSPSASSVAVRVTGDFGTTYPLDLGVALPVASLSDQTRVGVGLSAVYPAVELRHASGHSFAIQGLHVVVGSGGRG